MDFSEAPKIPRGWLLELDRLKSGNSPFSSEKNWSGRNKNPHLVFVEGVKFSRSWLLELDPKARNMTQARISIFYILEKPKLP
ncbi:hypothetical protein PWEIH_08351 [Listeria weihenstephanensis FSL R9-0317]|uniref:Uncharacterized protein n=1 Tax=Listeria weihenstephanensis TaxID=1006155 RepID=A0A1S7FYD8_9LIST|nr:hypothetical protein UE46_16060 [Listeria weihenstephanensis]EUJ39033.1 hypothetical protein PWEIH_08351 [Listeria weihenstephanensis FSL R9-0317]